MHVMRLTTLIALLLAAPFSMAKEDEYAATIAVFKGAGESAQFFKSAYGYAVFPNIGKGGIGIGGAYGKGRVYRGGKWIGDTSMTQASVGLQLGGQVFQQIIFFEDERALTDFTSGNFEFGADVSAVAITAAAGASATTTGSSAGASGGQKDATTVGAYHKGMAIFTVAKGGLMYQAAVSGQHFSYKAK